MKQRGRKSTASLAVITAIPGQRPEPPAELTDEQAQLWRAVVATKPTDWFTDDSHPLLVGYCKHVTSFRSLNEQIDAFDAHWLRDPEGVKRCDMLMRMRDRESKRVESLARSMRLTQQSRYKAETAHNRAERIKKTKPWEQ